MNMRALDVTAAARMSGVSTAAVRHAMTTGQLQWKNIDGRRITTPRLLSAWLQAR